MNGRIEECSVFMLLSRECYEMVLDDDIYYSRERDYLKEKMGISGKNIYTSKDLFIPNIPNIQLASMTPRIYPNSFAAHFFEDLPFVGTDESGKHISRPLSRVSTSLDPVDAKSPKFLSFQYRPTKSESDESSIISNFPFPSIHSVGFRSSMRNSVPYIWYFPRSREQFETDSLSNVIPSVYAQLLPNGPLAASIDKMAQGIEDKSKGMFLKNSSMSEDKNNIDGLKFDVPYTLLSTSAIYSKSLSLVSYFEVSVDECRSDTLERSDRPRNSRSIPMLAIGLARSGFHFRKSLPGWTKYSIGYHSDDGRIYHSSTYSDYGYKFGEGDVIGCGIVYAGACPDQPNLLPTRREITKTNGNVRVFSTMQNVDVNGNTVAYGTTTEFSETFSVPLDSPEVEQNWSSINQDPYSRLHESIRRTAPQALRSPMAEGDALIGGHHRWPFLDATTCGHMWPRSSGPSLFFTLNGRMLGPSMVQIDVSEPWHAAVGVYGNVSATINFGSKPFAFDIFKFNRALLSRAVSPRPQVSPECARELRRRVEGDLLGKGILVAPPPPHSGSGAPIEGATVANPLTTESTGGDTAETPPALPKRVVMPDIEVMECCGAVVPFGKHLYYPERRGFEDFVVLHSFLQSRGCPSTLLSANSHADGATLHYSSSDDFCLPRDVGQQQEACFKRYYRSFSPPSDEASSETDDCKNPTTVDVDWTGIVLASNRLRRLYLTVLMHIQVQALSDSLLMGLQLRLGQPLIYGPGFQLDGEAVGYIRSAFQMRWEYRLSWDRFYQESPLSQLSQLSHTSNDVSVHMSSSHTTRFPFSSPGLDAKSDAGGPEEEAQVVGGVSNSNSRLPLEWDAYSRHNESRNGRRREIQSLRQEESKNDAVNEHVLQASQASKPNSSDKPSESARSSSDAGSEVNDPRLKVGYQYVCLHDPYSSRVIPALLDPLAFAREIGSLSEYDSRKLALSQCRLPSFGGLFFFEFPEAPVEVPRLRNHDRVVDVPLNGTEVNANVASGSSITSRSDENENEEEQPPLFRRYTHVAEHRLWGGAARRSLLHRALESRGVPHSSSLTQKTSSEPHANTKSANFSSSTIADPSEQWVRILIERLLSESSNPSNFENLDFSLDRNSRAVVGHMSDLFPLFVLLKENDVAFFARASRVYNSYFNKFERKISELRNSLEGTPESFLPFPRLFPGFFDESNWRKQDDVPFSDDDDDSASRSLDTPEEKNFSSRSLNFPASERGDPSSSAASRRPYRSFNENSSLESDDEEPPAIISIAPPPPTSTTSRPGSNRSSPTVNRRSI